MARLPAHHNQVQDRETPEMNHSKILLIQARRQEDPARPEEITSFAHRAGLPETAFVSHNLLNGPPTIHHGFQFRRCAQVAQEGPAFLGIPKRQKGCGETQKIAFSRFF